MNAFNWGGLLLSILSGIAQAAGSSVPQPGQPKSAWKNFGGAALSGALLGAFAHLGNLANPQPVPVAPVPVPAGPASAAILHSQT